MFSSCIASEELDRLHRTYLNNLPFAHLAIDHFLVDTLAFQLEADCRQAITNINASNDVTQNRKTALNTWHQMPPLMHQACSYFNSGSFIDFLEAVTGIHGLIPDPHLEGSGLHRTEHGGFLKMHTDFNYNRRLRLHRRLNVLYYLNSGYQEQWDGRLLLSRSPARQTTAAMVAIAPLFNRLVIFNTNDKTFHGHPDPHSFPEGFPRTSLAFYYYTTHRPLSERARLKATTTKYVPTRHEDFATSQVSLKSRIAYYLRRWTPFG